MKEILLSNTGKRQAIISTSEGGQAASTSGVDRCDVFPAQLNISVLGHKTKNERKAQSISPKVFAKDLHLVCLF